MPITTTTLTPTQIDTLKDLASWTCVEIDSTYSGRNMYGATCFGIVGRIDSYTEFLFRLANEDSDLVAIFSGSIVHVDDMGRDSIFYWPSVAGFPEDDKGDE